MSQPVRSLKPPLHSLKSVKFQNLLSFGPDGMELELGPLNVLIGPNASGKSNFISALSLLRALPSDLAPVLSEGGGTSEWIWQGSRGHRLASISDNVITPFRGLSSEDPKEASANAEAVPMASRQLHYFLQFQEEAQRFGLLREQLLDCDGGPRKRLAYFMIGEGEPMVWAVAPESIHRKRVPFGPDYRPQLSVLAQLQEPVRFPEITYLARLLSRYHLYRDWHFGPYSDVRRSQRPDLPGDFLLEDASNLAVVLNDLDHRGLQSRVAEYLGRFYGHAVGVKVRILGGTVQAYMMERGRETPVPPERLSDGTIRFLCLLAILLHPEPPPLVCIEEPELGFHPDVMPIIAELLVDASKRTQLVVTTHSPDLIDELSDTAESVVVCERTERGTQMERLDPEPLKEWIDNYRLGGAWKTGVIGGRR